MFNTFPIQSLSLLPEPVLSVYLDTSPASHTNLPSAHSYRSWFRRESHSLLAALPESEAGLLRPHIHRIEELLLHQPQQRPGLALFAGDGVWEPIPLSVQPQNELHWGSPMLWQLLAIALHHPPACIAFLSGSGAQLFHSHPGELLPLESLAFQLDTSHWRRMESAHAAERGAGLPHGPQRDLFERRRRSQYLRFLTGVAQKIAQLCDTHSLSRVCLLGPARDTRAVQHKLPEPLRSMSFSIPHTPRSSNPSQSLPFIDDLRRKFEQTRAEKLVEDLLNRSSGMVTGTDETLVELQRGRLSSLLLAEDFNPSLQFCPACGHAAASPVKECALCHGAQTTASLHEILPRLAAAHSCRIELLQQRAASRFRPAGSIGGYLRGRASAAHPESAATAA
jgi:hypothetical protein